MRLVIAAPFEIALDAADVRRVRAEDASGAFSILPGHADLLTALEVGVLSWKDAGGMDHHVALRGGTFSVGERGTLVRVATREAVVSDDLGELESQVLARMKSAQRADEATRVAATQLERALMQEVSRFARPRPGAQPPAGQRRPSPDGGA